MKHNDKTMALAEFLKVDPALIDNNYSHYYTINERTVKEGRTPEDFIKLAKDFRSLLNDEMADLITEAIIKPADKGREVYETVEKYLEPLKEKAAKRAEQLKTSHVNPKETVEDVYNRLKQDHGFVVNVLYHLVLAESSYNLDYTMSLRRAWLGQPVSDTRRDTVRNDGEYLVLTDREADEWEEEGLRSLFNDMTYDVRDTFVGNYLDEDRFVKDNSGNRGENISGYDGTENEQEYNGVTYYIYRHN